MSYDPEARRDTPLARQLQARIAVSGPLTVDEYMASCLDDPRLGYYRTRLAIGARGDFITAPEISQVFGELVGLWSAVVWQQMGMPRRVRLVELGPGRGTMMADALRALRGVPSLLDAVEVVLVEPSPVLAAMQQATLAASPTACRWTGSLAGIEPGPTIVLANEMLDVLPVRQLVLTQAGWRDRAVTWEDRRLAFTTIEARKTPPLPDVARHAIPGSVLESRDVSALTTDLARIAEGGPLAALFIDYGHEATGLGDTLQAVRAQRHEHPLTSPGEADLTAQVDFAAAGRAMRAAGLATDGPITQAELLGALGAVERASRLMSANPSRAPEIEAGIARLLSPQGMGTRFKALGVRSPGLPALPGFMPG